MDVSRRWFIGGLAAAGALGSHRLFSAPPDALCGGTAQLTFGIVTDVHVRMLADGSFAAGYDPKTLIDAFSYFRDRGVDAVLLTGDMADRGRGEELKAVADAFWRVFPDGKAPDGRKVEPIFMYGNHDWSGMSYMKGLFPDKAERARRAIVTDPRRWWRECFHEEWTPAFRKEVRGYSFFGAHWSQGGGCRGKDEVGCDVLGDFLLKNAAKVDPKLPFFYGQHPHPKGTCYSPWTWGQDNGGASKSLSPFANAVAFSGHSHLSLTDERSVWQGAYTSIGCGSLRYTGLGPNEMGVEGFENTSTPKGPASAVLNARKAMPIVPAHDCRQGLLVSVYADRIVYRRREFLSGLALGDDWVMPLGDERPFAFAARAKKASAPEFAAGATVKLSERKVRNRGKQRVDAYVLAFPQALARAGVRPRRYEIEVSSATEKQVFHLAAPGFFYAPTDPRARAECRFQVDKARCPAGEVTFAVTPVSDWGLRGRTIGA